MATITSRPGLVGTEADSVPFAHGEILVESREAAARVDAVRLAPTGPGVLAFEAEFAAHANA